MNDLNPIDPKAITPQLPERPITPVLPTLKSDTIKAPRTMDFPDAIRELINGRKIRREAWGDPRDYGLLKNGWLTILRGDKFHTWSVNDGDLEAQDWVVVIESN